MTTWEYAYLLEVPTRVPQFGPHGPTIYLLEDPSDCSVMSTKSLLSSFNELGFDGWVIQLPAIFGEHIVSPGSVYEKLVNKVLGGLNKPPGYNSKFEIEVGQATTYLLRRSTSS